jgi:hypothetical protein
MNRDMGEIETQRQQGLQRRRDEEGNLAFRAAIEVLDNCKGDEIVAYAPYQRCPLLELHAYYAPSCVLWVS